MRRTLALLALFLFLSFWVSGGMGTGMPYLVGAHYYVWFSANFSHGYLRARLKPAELPALGEYDSRDPAVAERHIALAVSHGIDFFSVDWWPGRASQNEAIDTGFLRASNIDKIRFCILYESSDLGDLRRGTGLVFDEATKDRFVSDLLAIARRYFSHPSYLKIGGRPVLIIYITRTFRGLFREAMTEMRKSLAAEGYQPFVIGDEIYWRVIEANEDPSTIPPFVADPQLSRIRLFDAITAYNLYHEDQRRHPGYGSTSRFIADSVKLYRRYRRVAGVPVVPDILPGFNDRGTRLGADHFAIPRRWTAEAPEGSFFIQSIEQIAKPLADPVLPMILITSWNEWNEDTAIEPLAAAPPTAEDESGQRLFTQGYRYEGFGTTYLDIVRDHLRH